MLSKIKWEHGTGLEDIKLWGLRPMRWALDELYEVIEELNGATTNHGKKLSLIYAMLENNIDLIDQALSRFANEYDEEQKNGLKTSNKEFSIITKNTGAI